MSSTVAINQTDPRYWRFALALCLDRLQAGQEILVPFDIGEINESRSIELMATGFQQAADVHFALVAIRNVLRILEDRVAKTHDERLKTALGEFRSASPDAWDLRDILEHLLDYEAGEGNLQKAGRMPADEHLPNLIYRSTDASGEIVLLFNHEKRNIEIKAAALKAIEIAGELEAVERGE
jgi:hypothetical protein